MKTDAIIKKVKGLLALARDHKDQSTVDEESQLALVMAKKLMLKYHIKKEDLEDTEIEEVQVAVFDHFDWWKEALSSLIGEHFRVKTYYSKSKLSKTVLKYYGLKKDVALAKAVYLMALKSVIYYTEHFIAININSNINSSAKDYIIGFLAGLQEKFNRFNEQVRVIASRELMLSLKVPTQVETAYHTLSAQFEKSNLSLPQVEDFKSYEEGFFQASLLNFDHVKRSDTKHITA
ncbi:MULTISPECIES: DUF2786 domain-containing protein [Lactococcus]|jgi:hypothetical protein|uniref:DUF2786 domain-containing protein n=1 Tax=Lactococcus formosensis TaxID=1281486 RepID=A0A9Q9D7R9_9LACT|nr:MULTISPECIES: DUF2786 domain-containing protein [Lactococcus]USI66590.1 DUF2786 domain-containing protein [Lactococcus petauri]USI69034.1 DUF2786 domain-containing protein [Lactococcus petauri]USJ21221.1 DUF2786 domain-containing protein [Lactococcus formosensis]WJE13701.1 DUF2786 domain-containing protein [Lactococcus petauri]